MSTSIAKIEANRANAKHSTGPRTSAGKRRSRHNAFKHGFRANLDLMEDRENMSDFTALHGSVLATYWPVSAYENVLCTRIAVSLWRLDRATIAEAGLVLGPTFAPDADSDDATKANGVTEADASIDADADIDDEAGAESEADRAAADRRLDPDDPLAKAVADSFERGFGAGGIGTLSRYEAHLAQDIARNVRLFEHARAHREDVRAFWAECKEDAANQAEAAAAARSR